MAAEVAAPIPLGNRPAIPKVEAAPPSDGAAEPGNRDDAADDGAVEEIEESDESEGDGVVPARMEPIPPAVRGAAAGGFTVPTDVSMRA